MRSWLYARQPVVPGFIFGAAIGYDCSILLVGQNQLIAMDVHPAWIVRAYGGVSIVKGIVGTVVPDGRLGHVFTPY
jgi:hypothetical protein